jgi:D-tagatose-1,6-bisphosphate aldolase subunit GatZ/KbaZ
MIPHPLLELAQNRDRRPAQGLYAICSANRFALEAGVRQALDDETPVLIESTSNQVNQCGGYTGMTPSDFAVFASGIAADMGLPPERLILGGDHLGPNAWRGEPAAAAMDKGRTLVADCVKAGYTKIHLDASMACADDPVRLEQETVADRAAALCAAAESARAPEVPGPFYIIGSEVPPPGGARDEAEGMHITAVADVEATIAAARDAFRARKLDEAWERVIAVVVQPGVEFGHDTVEDYDPARSRELVACIERQPGLVYEAHSTDYQSAGAMHRLVDDHFAILKVGPWLTYALREGLFALEAIEREWLAGHSGADLSRLAETLDAVMDAQPGYWKGYHAAGDDLVMQRRYSYSDRIRYYWTDPRVQDALGRLLSNLEGREVPMPLLSQYMSRQYDAVRAGQVRNEARALVRHKIMEVTGLYARACGTSGQTTWYNKER